ncbi:hypothetical protein ACS0TY_021067 [Phlomoides rotata]
MPQCPYDPPKPQHQLRHGLHLRHLNRPLPQPLVPPLHPNQPTKLSLIVYFHGGGFNTFGSNSQCYDELCSQLSARLPAVIVSVNYRLAPEHCYPCRYDNCLDALKFIDDRENFTILPSNADLENCFVSGDSACRNITHHVTHRACRNSDELKKKPFFGGEERSESEVRLKKAPVKNRKIIVKEGNSLI